MRHSPFRVLVPFVALAALPASAQSFDAVSQAKGWAHQDRDFSFTFYDPSTRSLVTWDKGFGVMNTLSLAKLDAVPEMWLMDRYNNAWVISGDMLYFITKDGKVDRKDKLPAPVADVAWDSQAGFVLCYRTAAPYLEMRDMKDGDVVWTRGQKPKKGESAEKSLYRVSLKVFPGGDSQVYVTDGASFNLSVFTGKKGEPAGRAEFTLNGQPSPAINYASIDPGPICPNIGKETMYAAVDSRALPPAAAGSLNGLLLAKLDLALSTIVLEPTGLTPDNRFIGVVDGQATFIKPEGGLVFVPVK